MKKMFNKVNCNNVISISVETKPYITPEFTFIPISSLEYKNNKEKYDKELSAYHTFTPISPLVKFRSIYEEVNHPIYVRKVDW